MVRRAERELGKYIVLEMLNEVGVGGVPEKLLEAIDYALSRIEDIYEGPESIQELMYMDPKKIFLEKY